VRSNLSKKKKGDAVKKRWMGAKEKNNWGQKEKKKGIGNRLNVSGQSSYRQRSPWREDGPEGGDIKQLT